MNRGLIYLNALCPGNPFLKVFKVFQANFLLLVQLVRVFLEFGEGRDPLLDQILCLGRSDPRHACHQVDGHTRVVRPNLFQFSKFSRRQKLVNLFRDFLTHLKRN